MRVAPSPRPRAHTISNHARQSITARGSGTGAGSARARELTPDEAISSRTGPVDGIVAVFAGSRASETGVIHTRAMSSFKKASRHSQALYRDGMAAFPGHTTPPPTNAIPPCHVARAIASNQLAPIRFKSIIHAFTCVPFP